ncbi:MAG: HPr(Ser) kinase/phosphatase [Clostridiales bacterium]|nr:HPr(Ser) kinase/phosphatase [Clostridiales bacterium]
MHDKEFSISLEEIIKDFDLEVIYGPEGFEKIRVCHDDINRPGLQLAGFFEDFDADRIQIMGMVETLFVRSFESAERTACFERLFSKKVPIVIFTRSIEIIPECLTMAEKYGVTILRTNQYTSDFTGDLIGKLRVALAPRITRHGVLVEVYGEGILILGDSGVGKSETAIELVKRGHRLVADDAVEIKKVSDHTLVGAAPEIIRHFIELRGIGVIDVRRIFGMGSVKPTERIDLVINLEQWVEGKHYDRLGLENQYTNILDLDIPSLTVPVKPGRNLAVIIEVASMNNRNKKFGYNAAAELSDRVYKSTSVNVTSKFI